MNSYCALNIRSHAKLSALATRVPAVLSVLLEVLLNNSMFDLSSNIPTSDVGNVNNLEGRKSFSHQRKLVLQELVFFSVYTARLVVIVHELERLSNAVRSS